MVSDWQKAVFAWSFGMVWGAAQAILQFVYRNWFCDRFWFMKKDYLEYREKQYEQPEPEPVLTKEQEESLEEQWPTSTEGSDDEWLSAARYYEEAEKCDRVYRRAEAEYLEVVKNTAPDDPVREKYKPKPYPTNQEIKQSFFKHCGMFTN